MGSFSLMHWAVVVCVLMLLFGGGRISALMGDVAKGIKSFKKGIAEEVDLPADAPSARISDQRGSEQSAVRSSTKVE